MYDEKEDEDENLKDDDLEYTKKSEFSKARVVEDAVRKVEDTRSQEMKEGYFNFITLPTGDVKKIYIPDSRKAFIGAVESLKSILKPEIERDGRMQKALEDFNKTKKELFENYAVKRLIGNGNSITELEEKYIPEVDELIPIQVNTKNKRNFVTGSFIDEKKGIYNSNVRCYWNGIVDLYDIIFAELNVLLSTKKVNFFKQGVRY